MVILRFSKVILWFSEVILRFSKVIPVKTQSLEQTFRCLDVRKNGAANVQKPGWQMSQNLGGRCAGGKCYTTLRWHHVAQLYIIVMCVQYWIFSVLFFVCPLNIQWVLAIAMTIVREGNVLILTAICNRVAANKDDDSLESIVNSLVIFYHQTFLSVCVAILGTDTTNYVCVALDFLCNMFLLYKYKTLS